MRFIAPVVTNDTRSMVVEAMAPNPEGVLRPGLFATAELELPKQGTARFAPLAARAADGRGGPGVRRPRRRGPRTGRRPGRGRQREGGNPRRPDGPARLLVARPELVHDGDRGAPMNQLAALCVKRPVFATVLILVLVVFGVFGYTKLGLDRFPKVDFPIITVTTRQPGSAPEDIETQITDKIEEAVNTISGIEELRSTSSEGISQVFIQFVLEKDGDVAAQEVRDKINRVLPELPKDIDQPTVEKLDPDSTPILTIAVSAPAADDDPRHHRVLRQGAAAAVGDGFRRRPGDDRRRPGPADQRAARSAAAARLQADGGRRGRRLRRSEPPDAQRLDEGRLDGIHPADHGPRRATCGRWTPSPWPTATAGPSPSATWAAPKTRPRRSRAPRSTTTRPACC